MGRRTKTLSREDFNRIQEALKSVGIDPDTVLSDTLNEYRSFGYSVDHIIELVIAYHKPKEAK
jgi:hypothetical protein